MIPRTHKFKDTASRQEVARPQKRGGWEGRGGVDYGGDSDKVLGIEIAVTVTQHCGCS